VKRVLIVEDEPHLQQLLAMQLTMSMDYEAVTADGGHQAIDILLSQPVDLVLTDLCMNDGNGLELLSWMNRNIATPPPVILMSGSQAPTDKCPPYRGYLEILPKPFDLDLLDKKIDGLPGFLRTKPHRVHATIH